jgi:hypothetical protein
MTFEGGYRIDVSVIVCATVVQKHLQGPYLVAELSNAERCLEYLLVILACRLVAMQQS